MLVYNLKQRINRIRYRYLMKSINDSVTKYSTYVLKRNEMEQYALHSKETGISKENVCEEELVVSLTTHGARYYDAYLAIESIMQGSVKPNRIILWVPDELKDRPVPMTLLNQIERGLEIRYVKDIKSYTKLIYALKEFPDSSIITIDDDVIYPHDTVENLTEAHKAHKNMICANDCLIVPGKLKRRGWSMMDWERPEKHWSIVDRCVFEGFAGVLYPPHCLSDEVFREDMFLGICGTTDDIWFSAMSMLKGTKCIYACPDMEGFRIVSNYSVQGTALSRINDRKNQENIHKVFKEYSLY